MEQGRKHRIALCSDFFYPSLGGVEMHIWSLAQQLRLMGHFVIVITTEHGNRVGVRIMTNSLKVYYLPYPAFVNTNSFFGFFHALPILRDIFVRERIEIVHGHQSSSSLIHHCILQGKLMSLKTVFTEHSLYGFDKVGAINLNKVLKFTLSTCDLSIGVSEACRTNIIMRASVPRDKVISIANAVNAEAFTPDQAKRVASEKHGEIINVIVVSRLEQRKGTDLVAHLIPLVCSKHPHVNFIIGGDGQKRLVLDEMIERHSLHDRVEMVGEVPHSQVRDVLNRGSIFLNCSLTEAFCIAILEAACCGLLVVSTNVGGVPEVLPEDMIYFPREDDDLVHELLGALERAMGDLHKVDHQLNHQRLKDHYTWRNVAEQTVRLAYDRVVLEPDLEYFYLLNQYWSTGYFSGLFAVYLVVMQSMVLWFLDWYIPREHIPLALDFAE